MISALSFIHGFLSEARGSVAAMTGIMLPVLLVATGGVVDYNRLVNARMDLQSAVDAATLAAALKTGDAGREAAFAGIMDMNSKMNDSFTVESSNIHFDEKKSTLTGSVDATVKLIFGSLRFMAEIDVVTVGATVNISDRFFEIALVVDVSTSMSEMGRFEPAVDAIEAFVDRFEDVPNTRIAIVPFSSRVNYGLRRESAFGMWNGDPAIPDRWQSPGDHYNSNYTRRDWIDNQTFAMTRSTPKFRIDWMGCAEPRLDVAIETGNTAFVPSDSPPSETPLVAMDHNPAPGQTFCPPPIEALTDDGAHLKRAANALTSQGSTRLDAGMEAGWNVLSPRWASVWGTGQAPGFYETDILKMLVFMTDGQMNTMKDASNPYEYDWACKGSEDCNADATASLLATCQAIKETGIEIHTVSYDKDADTTAMRACASGRGLFQIAESEAGGSFIEKVYDRIADRILARRNILTH